MAPVEATLADADPEMDPNNADDNTDTFAAPPLKRPAAAMARFHEDRDDAHGYAGQAAPEPAFRDDHGAEKTFHRQARVPEFAGQIITQQTVSEGNRCDQRQWPADGAARHFQNDEDESDGHRHLHRAFEGSVLIGKGKLVPGDVETTDYPQSGECGADPAAEVGLGEKDENPRQRQGHVQGAADQVGHQPAEYQPDVEGDGRRAQSGP